MSQYTTELRYIINDNIDIFDFEFSFINEELKNKLKKDFINHFYFHEIGFETIAKFKHYLKIEFTETLPFYEEQMKINLMEYDIINNYDLKEEYTRKSNGQNSSSGTSEGTSQSSSVTNEEGKNFNIFANTPQTEVGEEFSHASTKTKDNTTGKSENTGNSSSNSRGSNEGNYKNEETFINHKVGNIGVQTQSDMLEKHLILQKKLKNIEKNFFDECEELFIMIY